MGWGRWTNFRLSGKEGASEGGEVSKNRTEIVGNGAIKGSGVGENRCMLVS